MTNITVFQMSDNKEPKVVYHKSDSNCNGTTVDQRFFQMFNDIFGKDMIAFLKQTDYGDYLDIVREFHTIERFRWSSKSNVNLVIPIRSIMENSISLCGRSIQQLISETNFELRRGRLIVDTARLKELFEPTINSVIYLIKEALENQIHAEINTLLMVGGFSECHLLENALHEAFPNKRIIIEDPGHVILKGAVIYGHRYGLIMPDTYGVKIAIPFDRKKHDRKHREIINGIEMCDFVFSPIIKKGDMPPNEPILRSYQTYYNHQKRFELMVYVSNNHRPSYIDDDGCQHLCTITVSFPDKTAGRRWVDVEYIFKETVCNVKAIDRITKTETTNEFPLIKH